MPLRMCVMNLTTLPASHRIAATAVWRGEGTKEGTGDPAPPGTAGGAGKSLRIALDGQVERGLAAVDEEQRRRAGRLRQAGPERVRCRDLCAIHFLDDVAFPKAGVSRAARGFDRR